MEKFVKTAYQNCLESLNTPPAELIALKRWKGISDKSTSVTFLQAGLQQFDPAHPEQNTKFIGRLGYEGPTEEVFDVIWCQWCLGHLSDEELVAFLRKAQKALRPKTEGFIIVKENLCSDGPDKSPRTVYDEEDSSLTRYVVTLLLGLLIHNRLQI